MLDEAGGVGDAPPELVEHAARHLQDAEPPIVAQYSKLTPDCLK